MAGSLVQDVKVSWNVSLSVKMHQFINSWFRCL